MSSVPDLRITSARLRSLNVVVVIFLIEVNLCNNSLTNRWTDRQTNESDDTAYT